MASKAPGPYPAPMLRGAAAPPPARPVPPPSPPRPVRFPPPSVRAGRRALAPQASLAKADPEEVATAVRSPGAGRGAITLVAARSPGWADGVRQGEREREPPPG